MGVCRGGETVVCVRLRLGEETVWSTHSYAHTRTLSLLNSSFGVTADTKRWIRNARACVREDAWAGFGATCVRLEAECRCNHEYLMGRNPIPLGETPSVVIGDATAVMHLPLFTLKGRGRPPYPPTTGGGLLEHAYRFSTSTDTRALPSLTHLQ